jgi:hypothetical protein
LISTGVEEVHFPALYSDADAASSKAQWEFLSLVKLEYFLLVLAAILAIEPFIASPYTTVYALIFFASLVVMLLRTLRKPDQDWYKCRALAESIKTTTWRYAARAHPFDDADEKDARSDFTKFLAAIFRANQHIGLHPVSKTPS